MLGRMMAMWRTIQNSMTLQNNICGQRMPIDAALQAFSCQQPRLSSTVSIIGSLDASRSIKSNCCRETPLAEPGIGLPAVGIA